MNKQEFEKAKRKAWLKYEKEHGTVPQNVRNIIENSFAGDWRETGIKDIEDTIEDYMGVAREYSEFCLNRSTGSQDGTSPEVEGAQRVYYKPFQKRLYFVEFLAENVITMRNLLSRSFTPHRRRDWKKLVASWNKMHPYNPFTADRLRTEFYRIIKDKRIQEEYFNKREREFAEFATEGKLKEAAMFAKSVVPLVVNKVIEGNFDVSDEPFPEWEQAVKRWRLQPVPHSRRDTAFEALLLHYALELEKKRQIEDELAESRRKSARRQRQVFLKK